MGAASVVKAVDIATQRDPGLRDAGIGPQVDLFVFDGPPEALDEHVVPPGPLAIHADGDLMGFQQVCEGHARKLADLIRVEDFGLAVFCQRLLDSLNAERCVERDRELPADNLPAEPVECGRELDEAAGATSLGLTTHGQ